MHRRILGRAGVVLAFLAIAVAATVAVGTDGTAQAGPGTEIYFTPFGRINPEPVIAFLNGPTQKVDVRVRNVANSNGLGSFEFTFKYNPIAGTATLVEEGAFLGSTGRATSCTPPEFDTTSFLPLYGVNVSCNTLAASPDGPLGSGVLATITFQPAGAPGFSNLEFVKTHLTDISGDVPIAHTGLVGSLRTAKCGDFDGNTAVTIGDILQLIQKFGTSVPPTDPKFDLNADNAVNISDLLIEVAQFGRNCTP
jgi:hypothetical protein